MVLTIHKQNNSAMSNLHTKQGCRGKGVWTGLFDFDSLQLELRYGGIIRDRGPPQMTITWIFFRNNDSNCTFDQEKVTLLVTMDNPIWNPAKRRKLFSPLANAGWLCSIKIIGPQKNHKYYLCFLCKKTHLTSTYYAAKKKVLQVCK